MPDTTKPTIVQNAGAVFTESHKSLNHPTNCSLPLQIAGCSTLAAYLIRLHIRTQRDESLSGPDDHPGSEDFSQLLMAVGAMPLPLPWLLTVEKRVDDPLGTQPTSTDLDGVVFASVDVSPHRNLGNANSLRCLRN
jgi:hypothetical protein